MSTPRERQDLDRLRDRLAEGWAKGLSTRQIGARLGLSRGSVIGHVNRARAHGDDRFRSRPTAPQPPAKSRVLKPVDESVGNRKPPRPPPAPPTPRLLVDLGP